MLSDKLLSKTDYNCDREIRTLELLKLRFGDANLHNCEVRQMELGSRSSWLRQGITNLRNCRVKCFELCESCFRCVDAASITLAGLATYS